ncbi:protein of unknown function [Psychrobacillus sp. OK028]|uniref:DUF960 family protein n=1 Tax=Psychrobacillus sp. OK028 TaxID=1884359 RepID=UPI000889D984|nr:DUF960 family protein [Psychrobacillus sp. OK028]SDO03156.1 protein of unknown function [Psychrobacillus sp. OK028]
MFEPKQVYITKRVKDEIIPEIIKGMMDSIMEIKNIVELDYLQVFDFSLSKNKKTTYINHSQEEPVYSKQLMLANLTNKFIGKVFIIDDGDCITVMLAEEY